jgi:hypothetical protein
LSCNRVRISCGKDFQCLTYVVEGDKRLCPASILIADRKEDAVPRYCRNQLLEEQRQQNRTNRRQIEVVDQEETLELHWLAVAHELPAAKNDHIVQANIQHRLLDRGQGRDARLEFEIGCRVARNFGVNFVEVRPEVDAEWPVEGRDGDSVEGCHLGYRACDPKRSRVWGTVGGEEVL